jgi:hypothetical protein
MIPNIICSIQSSALAESTLSLPIVEQYNPSCYLLLPKANITVLLSETSTRGSASQDHAAAKEALNMEEGSRKIWIEYSLCADDGKVCLLLADHLILYICIYTLGSWAYQSPSSNPP